MAGATADAQVRVSSDATQNFVESFYAALTSKRSTISSFYEAPSKRTDGSSSPNIIVNGNTYEEPKDFQEFMDRQSSVSYDIQSYDSQVVNPNYLDLDPKDKIVVSGKNISLLVIVNGCVRFGEEETGENRAFNEVFVLVPNKDAHTTKGRGASGRREWLIQSQNFRVVV